MPVSITHLKSGDRIPAFKLYNQHQILFKSSDMLGKKWVLFFYPNDLTATCTIEVCNLRDHYRKLQKAGFHIYGISRGDSTSKLKFIERNHLPFDLLADTNLTVSKKFGVFGDKPFMGKIIESIYRTTFVINEKGRIQAVIKNVMAKEATDQILASV